MTTARKFMSESDFELTINTARACAEAAIDQGAWAPWPADGVMQPGDVVELAQQLGRSPNADDMRLFEDEFRAAIDAVGIARGQAHDEVSL